MSSQLISIWGIVNNFQRVNMVDQLSIGVFVVSLEAMSQYIGVLKLRSKMTLDVKTVIG